MQASILLRTALEKAELGEFQELRGRIGAVVFKDSFARRYPATVPLFHFAGKVGELPGSQNGEQQGVCGIEKYYNDQLKGTHGQRVLVVDGLGNELAGTCGFGVGCGFDVGLHASPTSPRCIEGSSRRCICRNAT